VDDEQVVEFDQLAAADLVVDRLYRRGTAGHAGDDPLARLLPGVGSQGGLRRYGSLVKDSVKFVALYTSGLEPSWPDDVNTSTGTFTYFGDNRSSGRALHDTPKRGNLLLKTVFDRAHAGRSGRERVPPFLLFDRPAARSGIRFRGLLAPGSAQLGVEEDLVAVWHSANGERFQNYRAEFTILNVSSIARTWIDELAAGAPRGSGCPTAWLRWVETGCYEPFVVN